MLPLLLLLTAYVAQSQNASSITVQTSKGLVRGKHVSFGNDTSKLFYGEADVFLGIPFAKPPVGELRFRKPVEIDKYEGIWDAQKFPPRCLQNDDPLQPFPKELMMSEDCLYLNVFTRHASSSNKQPVLIFINGGNSFTTGGSNPKQLKGTVRNFVMRDIVVVTVQYRLGALGFFTTYNSDFPANLGLLDQVKALEWVRKEIRNFGGDPEEITLCGQNDGACSVNAHTLSPISQRLFKRAILQSGSIQGCFSITPEGGYIDLHVDDGTDKRINLNEAYFENLNAPLKQKTPSNSESQDDHDNATTLASSLSTTSTLGSTSTSWFIPSTTALTLSSVIATTTTLSSTPTTTDTVTIANLGTASSEIPVLSDINNPSQQFAAQACNMTAEEWRKGQLGKLQFCMHNLTFDVYLKVDGARTSAWMIVQDNYFMPDSIENLAKQRPNIPIIIGTVQDEDASYAFKLVSNGDVSEDKNKVFDKWFVDFAKKQGVYGENADKMRNIITQNYNISTAGTTTVTVPQAAGQYQDSDISSRVEYTSKESLTAKTTTGILYYEEFGTTHGFQNRKTETENYSKSTTISWDLKTVEVPSSTSSSSDTSAPPQFMQDDDLTSPYELTAMHSESSSTNTTVFPFENQSTMTYYETVARSSTEMSSVVYQNYDDSGFVFDKEQQQNTFGTTQPSFNGDTAKTASSYLSTASGTNSPQLYLKDSTSSTVAEMFYESSSETLYTTFSPNYFITVSQTMENSEGLTKSITTSQFSTVKGENLIYTTSGYPTNNEAKQSETWLQYNTYESTTVYSAVEVVTSTNPVLTAENISFTSTYDISNDYTTTLSEHYTVGEDGTSFARNDQTTAATYYVSGTTDYNYNNQKLTNTEPTETILYHSTTVLSLETVSVNPLSSPLSVTSEQYISKTDDQYYDPRPINQEPIQGNLSHFEQHYVVQVNFPCQFDFPCNIIQNELQYSQLPLEQRPNVSSVPFYSLSSPINATQSQPVDINGHPLYSTASLYHPQYDNPQILISPGSNINEQNIHQQYTPLGIQNQPDRSRFANTPQYSQVNPPPVRSYHDATIPPNCDREAVIETLKTITKISSDANVVSGISKEVNTLLSNGNTNVRLFEFVHATQIGSDRIPDVQPWQPVYQGVDILFLWMDEDAWSGANQITAHDIQVVNDLSGKWAEFVKTGSVSNWQPTTAQNYQYCKINVGSQMTQNYGATANTIFNELIPRSYTGENRQQQLPIQQRQAPEPRQSLYLTTRQQYPPDKQQQQLQPANYPSQQQEQQNSNNPPQLSWSISMSLPDLVINF